MSAPTQIGGLDVSTARIGYAAPGGELVSIVAKTGAEDPIRRLHELWVGLIRTVRAYPPIPDLMVIEDYSLGMVKKTRSSATGTHHTPVGVLSKIRLGEVGAVARLACYEWGVPITPVPVTTLKRFATGRGNADKEQMVAAAIRLGARGSVNHDEADAFHCRRIGRMAHGLESATEDYERDALSVVVW